MWPKFDYAKHQLKPSYIIKASLHCQKENALHVIVGFGQCGHINGSILDGAASIIFNHCGGGFGWEGAKKIKCTVCKDPTNTAMTMGEDSCGSPQNEERPSD